MVKGKEWYKIIAPETFKKKQIGETTTLDPNNLKGRVIEISLVDLIDDPTKYYFKLFFKITDVNGDKVNTIFHGHTCTKDYLARIVQNRTSRIDANEIVNFKDKKVRVKVIAIANRSVSITLKDKLRKFLTARIQKLKNTDLDKFITSIVKGDLQKDIKKEMNKIYPIRFLEFRKTEVIGD